MSLLFPSLLTSLALAADITWYDDDDGDGYGDSGEIVLADAASPPAGYVSVGGDCDDGSAAARPGGTEICDGLDNDCDGSFEEGSVCPYSVSTYDNHAYMFVTTASTWSSALSTCQAYGYSLATLADSAEAAWLNTEVDSRSTSKWWFGFNDAVPGM